MFPNEHMDDSTDIPITEVAALGAGLRRIRRAQGLTQEELALAAGVGRRFVIDLEAGKESVQTGALRRVVAALGASLVVRTVDR